MGLTIASSLKFCLQVIGASWFVFPTFVFSVAIPESVDVVVVGAGLAGLTAAKDLLAGGKSVLILEARNRVGGKILNRPLKNGGVTEVGAEFVGPTQDKELGLKTFTTYNEGSNILYRSNSRTEYVSDPPLGVPPVDLLALQQVAAAQAQLDAWAGEINVTAPWMHPKAKDWDNITFAQYIALSAFFPDAKFLLDIVSKTLFAAESKEISLFYVIQYIASAGNETTKGSLSRLTSTPGGSQESRVEGGTGLIPQRLAEKVGLNRIAFNAAVACITKTAAGYEIKSKAGTIKAKKIILALSPPLINKIAFSPALPFARQQLNGLTKMGSIGKGIAVYDSPFWRASKLNAQVISDKGTTRATFDNTPVDASYGALMGFILGDQMRAFDAKSEAEIQTAIVSDYVRYFGDKAAKPTEFIVQRWDLEGFSLGAPVAVAPPRVLSIYGPALRKPVGGIHFAGTETADYWVGYMDGAIRSGQRVAKEILALL
ncbi:amine oxidase [Melanomma pulvis-pyrius CBS 109.77]|uniref:Amine oxidase n=1 Tax=Melanomma pulvis-pyrius CBS 109.77 TaxID=1314802 RepID=A0A6A6XF17_9PLEO|nr:amine oxidase [Melanomma pulvis-pyrius CBS 109.77]